MSETQTVDARGLSCPEPVLKTRKLLSQLPGGSVDVLVDSGTARDNVRRMAEKAGWNVTIEPQTQGEFRLVLKK